MGSQFHCCEFSRLNGVDETTDKAGLGDSQNRNWFRRESYHSATKMADAVTRPNAQSGKLARSGRWRLHQRRWRCGDAEVRGGDINKKLVNTVCFGVTHLWLAF